MMFHLTYFFIPYLNNVSLLISHLKMSPDCLPKLVMSLSLVTTVGNLALALR